MVTTQASKKRFTPTEDQEQAAVVRILRLTPLLWCHVPNGGVRAWQTARRLQAAGVQRGVPDLLIFNPPPNHPDCIGAALEMKRAGTRGRVSEHQKHWLVALRGLGWKAEVCYGAQEAISWLKSLGYLSQLRF